MSRLKRTLTPLALAAAVALTASACTPDTTRGRVENDVPPSFAHAYALSEELQGHPAVTPTISSSECHSSINTTADSGPGSWGCDIGYTAAGKKKHVFLLVLIDSLGCYQAADTDHRDATIVDKATGTSLPDPKVGFDGCYSVYDGHTNTSKS
jgi:hypothetical protein